LINKDMRIARLTKASKKWLQLDYLAEWLFYDGLLKSNNYLSPKRTWLNKNGYTDQKPVKARKTKWV